MKPEPESGRISGAAGNEAFERLRLIGAREIVGYSAGAYKNAELVHKAFSTVKGSLFAIRMFHTDRGSEFDNALIDELLESFQINRSLSMKGCPYDNAVAESTFK